MLMLNLLKVSLKNETKSSGLQEFTNELPFLSKDSNKVSL